MPRFEYRGYPEDNKRVTGTIQAESVVEAFDLLKDRGIAVTFLAEEGREHWNWRLGWKWYDFWVGWFWDRKRKRLYICPLPTIVLEIWKD